MGVLHFLLELFLQIQARLGERIVLKGGAATQFYLPKEAQRTSVDIDMLFNGREEEIDDTLKQIENALGKDEENLFHFRKHVPKKPKTTLRSDNEIRIALRDKAIPDI